MVALVDLDMSTALRTQGTNLVSCIFLPVQKAISTWDQGVSNHCLFELANNDAIHIHLPEMYRHRYITWIENIEEVYLTQEMGFLEVILWRIFGVQPSCDQEGNPRNWASGLLSHDDPGLMSLPSDESPELSVFPGLMCRCSPHPIVAQPSNTKQYPAFQQSMCDCLKLGIPKNHLIITWKLPFWGIPFWTNHIGQCLFRFSGLHWLGTGLQELGHRCRGISVELWTVGLGCFSVFLLLGSPLLDRFARFVLQFYFLQSRNDVAAPVSESCGECFGPSYWNLETASFASFASFGSEDRKSAPVGFTLPRPKRLAI